MPDRNLVRAFIALWWTLGAVLVVMSVQTALHGAGHRTDHTDLHLAMLGTVEALAAALFLIPRTMRGGGAVLLGIFAVGFVVHVMHGEFASQLLIYAAGVVFCVVHGPVPLRRMTAAQ